MSRESKEPESDDLQQKLDALRRQLEQNELPEGMKQLLDDITHAHSDDAIATESEDDAMFSLALDAALKGIDISKRYPTFFGRLLLDAHARQDFLDALEILEQSKSGELESLPTAPSYDLSFLKEEPRPPRATIALTGPAQWRVAWQQTRDYLNSLFSSYLLAADYRSSSSLLEDTHLTLIDDLVTVDDSELAVLLDAVQPVEEPDSLRLSLLVTVQEKQLPDNLVAEITWGHYQATVPIRNNSIIAFPSLPLASVTDGEGQVVLADLHLTISTKN